MELLARSPRESESRSTLTMAELVKLTVKSLLTRTETSFLVKSLMNMVAASTRVKFFPVLEMVNLKLMAKTTLPLLSTNKTMLNLLNPMVMVLLTLTTKALEPPMEVPLLLTSIANPTPVVQDMVLLQATTVILDQEMGEFLLLSNSSPLNKYHSFSS